MKKALIYFFIALFLALVVQPNLVTNLTKGNQRVPKNTTSGIPATNETMEFNSKETNQTICLDAANNNNDANGVDINLDITQKLGTLLENAGYKVVYTRSEDVVVDNSERIQIANEENADYLISITTNSDTDNLQRGFSIMTQEKKKLNKLSTNISEQLEAINYTTFQGIDSDHYANFPILNKADTPAILIELGYTSNDIDLTNLSNDSVQDKIAEAITKGIVNTNK